MIKVFYPDRASAARNEPEPDPMFERLAWIEHPDGRVEVHLQHRAAR